MEQPIIDPKCYVALNNHSKIKPMSLTGGSKQDDKQDKPTVNRLRDSKGRFIKKPKVRL